MPTYDYKCKKCGIIFEKFQSMNDEQVKTCPDCGGEVERLISGGAGLIFKGSGFYITDYRKDSYKKAEKSDSPSSTVKDTPSAKDSSKASSSPTTK